MMSHASLSSHNQFLAFQVENISRSSYLNDYFSPSNIVAPAIQGQKHKRQAQEECLNIYTNPTSS